MRIIRSGSGYRLLSLGSGTKTCEPTGSMAWGIGFSRLASFGNGVTAMDPLGGCYFVPGAQVWERHICGKNTLLQKRKKKQMSLTSVKY